MKTDQPSAGARLANAVDAILWFAKWERGTDLRDGGKKRRELTALGNAIGELVPKVGVTSFLDFYGYGPARVPVEYALECIRIKSSELTLWEKRMLELRQAALERREMSADGPEPPKYFWWKNERHSLSPRFWALLSLLWGQQTVELQTVAEKVWEDEGEEIASSTIGAALSKLNARLATIGVPWTYGIDNGFVIRK